MIVLDKYGLTRNLEKKFGIEWRIRYNKGQITNWYPFRIYKTERAVYDALKSLKANQKKRFYGSDVEYRPYYTHYELPDRNAIPTAAIIRVPNVYDEQERSMYWEIKLKQIRTKTWLKTLFFSFS